MHEGFEKEIKTHQDTHQDKILEFCKEPKTTKEIMSYLGLKDRRNFYLKYMRPLLDSGRLQIFCIFSKFWEMLVLKEKEEASNGKEHVRNAWNVNRFYVVIWKYYRSYGAKGWN